MTKWDRRAPLLNGSTLPLRVEARDARRTPDRAESCSIQTSRLTIVDVEVRRLLRLGRIFDDRARAAATGPQPEAVPNQRGVSTARLSEHRAP
jgi:hypothetical protein